jgi:hypothetical protein
MKIVFKQILTVTLFSLLAACGGGGGGGGDSAQDASKQANVNELQGTWVYASDGSLQGGSCGLDSQGGFGKRLTMTISNTTYQSKTEECIILSGNAGFYLETDTGGGYFKIGGIYLRDQDPINNLSAIDFISNKTVYTAYRVQGSTLYLSDSSRLRDGLTQETRAYNNLLRFTKVTGGELTQATTSGFVAADFSGKYLYYVSGTSYQLASFNSDGTVVASNQLTSGIPILNSTLANWSINNGEMWISYQGEVQKYSLISEDKINRYYKINKTSNSGASSIVGWFYDQVTGLSQAQAFVATNQIP